MRQGIHFQGIEKYSPYFPNKNYSFIDYMKDCIIFIDEANRIKQLRYHHLEFREYFNQLENGKVLSGQFDSPFFHEDIIQRYEGKKTVCLDSLYKSSSDLIPQKTISITSRSMHPFHGKPMLWKDAWKKQNTGS